jgi:hypothetical protein
MIRDIGQNRRECADAQSTMVWDSNVMLTVLVRGKAEVAAGLAADGVAQGL